VLNNAVVGALHSFMLNCLYEIQDYGLASLREHFYVRIRDGDILTRKENAYWHYMFDVMLNAELNHNSSKLAIKRGVEFLLEKGK
jgi:hypothetical protein